MRCVQEIIDIHNASRIPLTQLPVVGLIQLRGVALCLVDAGMALLTKTTPEPLPAVAIVLNLDDIQVGLVGKRALQVTTHDSKNSAPLIANNSNLEHFNTTLKWQSDAAPALVIDPDRLRTVCQAGQDWS